jgi:hypothetical protein
MLPFLAASDHRWIASRLSLEIGRENLVTKPQSPFAGLKLLFPEQESQYLAKTDLAKKTQIQSPHRHSFMSLTGATVIVLLAFVYGRGLDNRGKCAIIMGGDVLSRKKVV